MPHGGDPIDAVLDRIMDELGNAGARAEVAESIEHSFATFQRCDELSGRVGRQNLITGARQIADATTTLEDQIHGVIAALSALENQLRTAEPLLVSYGFYPQPAVGRDELDALIEATYLPLQPWRWHVCDMRGFSPTRQRSDCHRDQSLIERKGIVRF